MNSRTTTPTVLTLLAAFGSIVLTFATSASSATADELTALDGVWIFVEDITEGRALEEMTPPMSSTSSLQTEQNGVVLGFGHGGVPRDVQIAFDGSTTELKDEETGAMIRCRAEWKDGALTYDIEYIRTSGDTNLVRREFRVTPEGMIVKFRGSVGLYRHKEDIPMPAPATATIADVAWISGAWVGTRGTGGAISFEERWSPPLGGAMLAVSRTVAKGRMGAFEYLRIVERDGGLVYVAQPGGASPTEFVMTEVSEKRAVFDNPRHDYPKRIVYELTDDGGLVATIGYLKGGTPRQFVFKPEAPAQ